MVAVLGKGLPRLLEELALAHADGSSAKLLGRLARVDLLVLDDWGLVPIKERERCYMLEISEDRHALRSTLLTNQLRDTTGMITSATRPSPTRSALGCYTTPTGSTSRPSRQKQAATSI